VYGACVSVLSTVHYVSESVCTVEGFYAEEWKWICLANVFCFWVSFSFPLFQEFIPLITLLHGSFPLSFFSPLSYNKFLNLDFFFRLHICRNLFSYAFITFGIISIDMGGSTVRDGFSFRQGQPVLCMLIK